MHEMSIMQSLFKILLEKAEQARAQKIRSVTIRVGRFSGIESNLLTTAFQIVSSDTLAEGARFEVKTNPLLLRCKHCGIVKIEEKLLFECPKCGSTDVQFEPNDELMVDNMEVEVADSDL